MADRPAGGDGGRLPWPDAMRGVAIGLVVLTHAAAPYVDHRASVAPLAWWIADLVESLGRIAVPLFVVVSGYFLLDAPDEPILAFWRRRLPKLLIPLAAWMYLDYAFYTALNHEPFDIADVTRRLATGDYGPYAVPLWFLYMMVGLTFATPFLRMICRAGGAFAFALACLVANAGPHLLEQLLARPIDPTFPAGFFPPYALYLVAGYLLRRHEAALGGTAAMAVASLALVAGLAVTAGLTAWSTPVADGPVFPHWYDYFAINVVAMALAAAVLLGRALADAPSVAGALALPGRHSLGIYLCHMPILSSAQSLTTMPGYLSSIAYLPLFASVAFLGAWGLSRGIAQVPVLRRIV
jgi:surface polysaccharide O-acyltransferase-like enzyme